MSVYFLSLHPSDPMCRPRAPRTALRKAPVGPTTDNFMRQLTRDMDNAFLDPDSNDLVLPVTPVEFTAFRRELRHPRFLNPHQVPFIR